MKLVKDIMKRRPVTVNEKDGIRGVCRILVRSQVSGLPVTNDAGKLVGFISERDVIAAVPKPKFDQATVRKIMTKRVRTIPEDAPITNASKIFSEEDYRLLPVMKGSKLVGIISRKDVVNFMMGNYY